MIWDNGLKRLVDKTDEVTSTNRSDTAALKRLHVTFPEALPFEIDGEEIGRTREFTVTIQPAAIRVR